MKKTISVIFAALFLLLCLLPSAGMLLWGESKPGANEILASAPALREKDGGLNVGFLSDFSDYIRDRFCFRQELITAWNRLNVRLFNASPAEDVTAGRDGWLYYADTLPDYTRSAVLTERESWCAARTVMLMQEYAEAQGCAFLFTIAPNKNSLYPAHMPELPVLPGESSAERFAETYTAMGGNYLDLFAVFSAEDGELYWHTDSHWNGKGAALAADAVLSALGKDERWTAGGFVEAEPHRGDLYEMLYPAGKDTEPDYAPAGGFTYEHTRPFRGPTDLRIDTASAGREGSLLCFRDSFGNNLHPYLAESFTSAVFSRQTAYDLTAIADYAADTVVIELVERNLRWLLDYDPVFPAPERDKITVLPFVADALDVSASAEAARRGEWVTLRGTLPTAADGDSPVFLLCGGAFYEALPRPEGFALTLPEGVSLSDAQLVYFSEGRCVSAALSVTEKE